MEKEITVTADVEIHVRKDGFTSVENTINDLNKLMLNKPFRMYGASYLPQHGQKLGKVNSVVRLRVSSDMLSAVFDLKESLPHYISTIRFY